MNPTATSKTTKNYSRKADVTYGNLKFLVENGGSKALIDKAVAQLMKEGWVTYKNLPKGWLRSNPRNKSTAIQYLVFDPFCLKFGSKHSAVGGLKKMGLRKQYIAKFIVGDSDIEHIVGTETHDDWISGDETVPEGWKIRKDKKNPEPMAVEILSPENLKNRVSALMQI